MDLSIFTITFADFSPRFYFHIIFFSMICYLHFYWSKRRFYIKVINKIQKWIFWVQLNTHWIHCLFASTIWDRTGQDRTILQKSINNRHTKQDFFSIKRHGKLQKDRLGRTPFIIPLIVELFSHIFTLTHRWKCFIYFVKWRWKWAKNQFKTVNFS